MPLDTSSRRELIRDGQTDHDLAAAVSRGELQRIRPGRYVESQLWSTAYRGDRQVALARAAHDAAHAPPVFAYVTAAALHGLPLFDVSDDRAHVMSRDARSGASNACVVRHRDRWDGEVVAVGGLLATTRARTVVDLARTAVRTTGVGVADAALRAAARVPGSRALDLDAAERERRAMLALIDAASRVRGVRRAREIVTFADPRAESVGESVSRLHLADLGFRDVACQVRVRTADREYEVDFDIGGVLGEFDGVTKYVDRGMRRGRTAEQVVVEEKRREDAIRAASGKRMIRWVMRDIATRDAFRRMLAAHGVRP